jgi:hypothetical protein
VARLLETICLPTGTVLETEIGPHTDKSSSELDLSSGMFSALSAGDPLLAAVLITDFRRGEALGTRDHVPSLVQGCGTTEVDEPRCYVAFPDTVRVRKMRIA